MYKGKGERAECKNYRGVSVSSVVGKIYGRILVDTVCRGVIFIQCTAKHSRVCRESFEED